jgi:hypothetical protein
VSPLHLARSASTIQETTSAQLALQTVTLVHLTLESVPNANQHLLTIPLQTLAPALAISTRLHLLLQIPVQTAPKTAPRVPIPQVYAHSASQRLV